ncbi:hypothetical protein SDC9_210558 [bioreactor metagenome]|uniref:Uncharacterized protein n=1 Tax=bioreactor metagenome TaxID=1076179 RepID=A0A645JGJ7_9ZZZZ
MVFPGSSVGYLCVVIIDVVSRPRPPGRASVCAGAPPLPTPIRSSAARLMRRRRHRAATTWIGRVTTAVVSLATAQSPQRLTSLSPGLELRQANSFGTVAPDRRSNPCAFDRWVSAPASDRQLDP